MLSRSFSRLPVMEVDFLGAIVTWPEAPEVDVRWPFPELLRVEICLA
jgi:hypothetical protein